MGELVDARTAAERLGVDVRSLYAYVSRGSLRRVPGPDGHSSRYDSDDLELLARRSRPRTLPRPAASIDLVIATRVSTVTDGMVRYRGQDVLELVTADEPFEYVADLLWRAAADGPGASGNGPAVPGNGPAAPGWNQPASEAEPPPDLLGGAAGDLPVLHRFAVAVAALPASTAPASTAPAPDWPGWGRRIISCLIAAGGAAPAGADGDPVPPGVPAGTSSVAPSDSSGTGLVALRLWPRWSPLRPTAARVRALNTALVLLAEHELALSTLAVRVAASARAAPAACVLAGLSTLSGSLHGDAPRAVHQMLRDRARGRPPAEVPGRAGSAGRAGSVIGFGHPVHAHGDPRAAPLLDAVSAFASPSDRDLIERVRAGSPAPPNVDFALGALSYAARMPPQAPTAIFAIARTAGWIAHAAEEHAEPPIRFRGRALRPVRRPRLTWMHRSGAGQGGDDLLDEQVQAGAVVGDFGEVADGVGHAQGVHALRARAQPTVKPVKALPRSAAAAHWDVRPTGQAEMSFTVRQCVTVSWGNSNRAWRS